MSHSITAL